MYICDFHLGINSEIELLKMLSPACWPPMPYVAALFHCQNFDVKRNEKFNSNYSVCVSGVFMLLVKHWTYY